MLVPLENISLICRDHHSRRIDSKLNARHPWPLIREGSLSTTPAVTRALGVFLSFMPIQWTAFYDKQRVLYFCMGVVVTFENVLLYWRRHHYRLRAINVTYAGHSWSLSCEISLACHI